MREICNCFKVTSLVWLLAGASLWFPFSGAGCGDSFTFCSPSLTWTTFRNLAVHCFQLVYYSMTGTFWSLQYYEKLWPSTSPLLLLLFCFWLFFVVFCFPESIFVLEYLYGKYSVFIFIPYHPTIPRCLMLIQSCITICPGWILKIRFLDVIPPGIEEFSWSTAGRYMFTPKPQPAEQLFRFQRSKSR